MEDLFYREISILLSDNHSPFRKTRKSPPASLWCFHSIISKRHKAWCKADLFLVYHMGIRFLIKFGRLNLPFWSYALSLFKAKLQVNKG